MSVAAQQSPGSTRSLDRALRVVAAVIALLMVVLVARMPAESMATDTGVSTSPDPGRLPHAPDFNPAAATPVDDSRPAEVAQPAPPAMRRQPVATKPPAMNTKTDNNPPLARQPITVAAIPRGAPEMAALPASPVKVDAAAPSADEATAVAVIPPVEPAALAPPEAGAVESSPPPVAEIVAESWLAYEEFPPAMQLAQLADEQPVAVSVAESRSEQQSRFQRLDQQGAPAADGNPWSCVRDNRNDLVWEVKTRGGGLRDAAHVYSWFDPSQQGPAGIRDGGRCTGGIDCDTDGYQKAVNQLELCGFDDWRLPERQELQTLVEVGADRNAASIDSEYFPAGLASWYWSASANEQRPDYAWYVLFRNGLPLNDLKARPKHVRLVRGERLVVASSR